MCLATPGKIISIKDENAVVDFDGIKKEVNVSLVPRAGKDDYVIVHAGFAIQKMEEKDAMDIFRIQKEFHEKNNKQKHHGRNFAGNSCDC